MERRQAYQPMQRVPGSSLSRAAEPIEFSPDYPERVDSVGIRETCDLAADRFGQIADDYFSLWSAEPNPRSDIFVTLLNQIIQQVETEIARLWTEGSEWHANWFGRACRAKLDEALSIVVTERTRAARNLEIRRLAEQPRQPERSNGIGGEPLSEPEHPGKVTENGGSQRTAPALGLNSSGGADRQSFAVADSTKSERRRAVVDPILKANQWTVNKWGTRAGVGKNCAYEYLSGRRNLSRANRLALAQVLGLEAEDLPN
jgi:hypothetical protein